MSQQNETQDSNDGENPAPACAMPIGQNVMCWRQYWAATPHALSEDRSALHAMLRDFAEVERQYRGVVEEYGMRVTYCEFLCEQAPWGVRQLRRLARRLKTLLPNTRRTP